MTFGSEPAEPEDEATRAARIARARAAFRRRRWLTNAMALRTAQFPIYAAEGWPAQLAGHGSQDDRLTEITIGHHETADADPLAGDRPRLTITTQCEEHHPGLLGQARTALRNWAAPNAEPWPDASHAALTLWHSARNRARRAAVLDAGQSSSSSRSTTRRRRR